MFRSFLYSSRILSYSSYYNRSILSSFKCFYCKNKEIHEKADELIDYLFTGEPSFFEEIKRCKAIPNIKNYNLVLQGLCNNNYNSRITLLLNEMKERNIKKDSMTYTILMSYYSSLKDIKTMISLFDDVVKDNIKPKALFYMPLIVFLTSHQNFEKGKEVIDYIKESKISYTIELYNSILYHLYVKQDIKAYKQSINDLERSNIKLNIETYEGILTFYASIEDRESLMKYYNKVKSDFNDEITSGIYNAILLFYCKTRNGEGFHNTLEDMKNNNKINYKTIITLLIYTCTPGNTNRLHEILDLKNKYNIQSNNELDYVIDTIENPQNYQRKE